MQDFKIVFTKLFAFKLLNILQEILCNKVLISGSFDRKMKTCAFRAFLLSVIPSLLLFSNFILLYRTQVERTSEKKRERKKALVPDVTYFMKSFKSEYVIAKSLREYDGRSEFKLS